MFNVAGPHHLHMAFFMLIPYLHPSTSTERIAFFSVFFRQEYFSRFNFTFNESVLGYYDVFEEKQKCLAMLPHKNTNRWEVLP